MRLPAFAFALLFAVVLSARADAQSSGPTNPLCCTVQADSTSASGTCAPASAGGGTGTASAPNSLGVQTRCPPPADKMIEIEIPSAGTTTGATLAVVKQEPKTGFVGACLSPNLNYVSTNLNLVPTLPTVCYQVKTTGGGASVGTHSYTVVTAHADSVFQSYSTLDRTPATANPDSYQVLLTCYPHDAQGNCPAPSHAISRSCCDVGARMTALKTANQLPQFARGFASMPTFP